MVGFNVLSKAIYYSPSYQMMGLLMYHCMVYASSNSVYGSTTVHDLSFWISPWWRVVPASHSDPNLSVEESEYALSYGLGFPLENSAGLPSLTTTVGCT